MSRKATEFQKKEMSKMYRGKEIFKPLNTGWIDEHVACVREWVANIFFYRKGGTTIMIDAGDNKLAVRSLAELEARLKKLGVKPLFITGHTGWTDNFDFAFAHKDRLCSPFGKRVHDPSAPYDAYDETDDTKEKAQAGRLKGIGR